VSGPRVAGLTGLTLSDAPLVCRDCVWWQSPPGRSVEKQKWIGRAESDWGPWGTVYYEVDGRVLGSMQYGPSKLFPRAETLPAGPPSPDAVLVTCAYLLETSTLWVMQSLFLAAIGDAKDKEAKALEAFAYRYAEGESRYERFSVHKTIFPADFLADFGFVSVRSSGRVELSRLELGGLVSVAEPGRAKVLRRMKEALVPTPVPHGSRSV
jgi:hypothetical protein